MPYPPSLATDKPSPHLTAWEPALSQLRGLRPADLDEIVERWLSIQSIHTLRLCERRPTVTTYQATFGKPPFSVAVQIRVHQRRNRLQSHHIEAFAGSLIRWGAGVGVLVTTGDLSRTVTRAAAQYRSPRIQVVAGDQWAAQLADARAGLRHRSLWRWVVDLNQVFRSEHRPDPNSKVC